MAAQSRLRDPRYELDVTAGEADRFWAEQKCRAAEMTHIGPKRAEQVVEWMKVTPGWSVEDYDVYYADLHRPTWWGQFFQDIWKPRKLLDKLLPFMDRVRATAQQLSGPTLAQAVRTAALVLGVVAVLMLAVLFFDNVWWSVLMAAMRLRSRGKGGA